MPDSLMFLMIGFGIFLLMLFALTSHFQKIEERIYEDNKEQKKQPNNKQSNKQDDLRLTEKDFNMFMAFLLEKNIITFNEFNTILQKATPYFTKK